MNRLTEFFELFDKIIDNKREQTIICSRGLATALFDHNKFNYWDNGIKELQKPRIINSFGGKSHIIGSIGRIRIAIEPAIEYNNMSIYDGNYRKIFNFKEINLKLDDII